MSPADSPAQLQRRCVVALRDALGAELIETHISYVLIAAGQAWKIKKALQLDFVDLRSLAQRRFYCDEELRLNRRTAPQIYQQVLPLTGSSDAPRLGGDGAAIDWVLQMRAFDQAGLWNRLTARGELGAAQVDALVEVLCALHETADVASADSRFGTPEQLRAPMSNNLRTLGGLCRDGDERQSLQALCEWEASTFAELHDAFRQRHAAGAVRECHGDLHLGNVTQIDGRPVLFDCLEFSADLRWTDVASDVAFMAMDLQAHGLPALAHRFVNGWVERSGDVGALRVLRWYRVHRALVRATVAGLRRQQLGDNGTGNDSGGHSDAAAGAEMRRYLGVAMMCSRATPPVLLLTHGFSGSGKTAATQGLLEACGAVRFRADVQRKRLYGLHALQRSDAAQRAQLYSDEAHRATMQRLLAHAEVALRSGWVVILDATFLAAKARLQARALAQRLGAGFAILHFDAAPDVLRERIRRRGERGDDASDADLAVLEAQLRQAQPFAPDERDAVIAVDAQTRLDAPAAPARWLALAPLLAARGVSLQAWTDWQNPRSV